MSGYREPSYDPNQYEQLGHPLRPFNWVQWTGVALGVVGLVLTSLYWLSKFGWTEQKFDAFRTSFVLLLVGAALINSRRHPPYDPAPELAAQRKRWLLITLAVCAAILGAAALIEFTGA